MRLPLLLRFFAEPSRTLALASPELQRVLDAAIFEPAAYQAAAPRSLPELIPAPDRTHLATPAGTLFCEMTHAPAPLLATVLSLLDHALDMDVGRYVRGSRAAAVIFYTVVLAVRIVAYARFALSPTARRVRGLERVVQSPEVFEAIRSGVGALRAKLEDHALPVLQGWYAKLREADQSHDACTCAAHMALVVGGYARGAELDDRGVFCLLSSRVFINMHLGDFDSSPSHADTALAHATRKTTLGDAQRGVGGSWPLGFSPIELMGLWQHHLGATLRWLTAHPRRASDLMEAVAQLEPTVGGSSSGGGGGNGSHAAAAAAAGAAPLPTRLWSSMVGCGCSGRFVLQHAPGDADSADSSDPAASRQEGAGATAAADTDSARDDGTVAPRRRSSTRRPIAARARRSLDPAGGAAQYEAWLRKRVCSLEETEINVQLGQLTWKRHHMQLLDRAICEHPDFVAVFGEDAASGRHQCAEVKRSEHRRWLRLLGARHDLHIWSAEERPPPPPPLAITKLFHAEAEPPERAPSRRSSERRPSKPGTSAPPPSEAALRFDPAHGWIVRTLEAFKSSLPSLEQLDDFGLVHVADDCALLTAVVPSGGRKELLVEREPPSLQVFGIHSHGRKWMRSLEYSSDTNRSLGELNGRVGLMLQPSPHWQAGEAAEPYAPTTSLVITRALVYGDAGSVETYVPPRHLSGVLPQALLLQYDFWQRPDGTLLAQRRGGTKGMPPLNAPDELVVSLAADGRATVRRVPLDACGVQQRDRARVLLSSAHIPRHDALGALLSVLGRAEDRAHMLLWSEAGEGSGASGADGGGEGGHSNAAGGGSPGGGGGDGSGGSASGGGALAGGEAAGGEAAGGEAAGEFVPPSLDVSLEGADHSSRRSSREERQDSPSPRGSRRPSVAIAPALAVGLVELPRLRLSFTAAHGSDGQMVLRSVEHPGLTLGWVACERLGALLRGLPHALLLLSASGDVSVLLSSLCKPCRLVHEANPLHTQLMLLRHAPGWNRKLSTSRHYLYEVHRSKSYLTPSSLAAAIYLLVLRWLARDFEAAFAIAPSCVTDAPLSAEEAQLWGLLKELEHDHEPAAHATRLKLHLGARACPELPCPWDASRELVMYLSKLEHVPVGCRLSAEEELTLLSELAERPPLRAYPMAEHRAAFLQAAFAAESAPSSIPVPTAAAFGSAGEYGVADALHASFDCPADGAALLEPEALLGWQRRLGSIAYNRPAAVTGLHAMRMLEEWLATPSLGADGKGFGTLYDLLTNALVSRIMIDDSAQMLGSLLTRLIAPRVHDELLPVLRLLEADPSLASRMVAVAPRLETRLGVTCLDLA